MLRGTGCDHTAATIWGSLFVDPRYSNETHKQTMQVKADLTEPSTAQG